MIINVEGTDIETRDIVSIKDAGWRMHGFVIRLADSSSIGISRKQKYDMMPADCGRINDRYRKLKEKVEKLWNEDKRDIPTLTL